MTPLEIPGYCEAVSRERLVRDAAFLALPENIAGFELRQMTLRDYMVARLSPDLRKMINGDTPTPVELATFLWFMSVGYTSSDKDRKRFMVRCRYFYPPALPWLHLPRAMANWRHNNDSALNRMAETLIEVRQYISETLQDQPPRTSCTDCYTPSYYSEGVFWCAIMARQYGWTEATTLEMPVKRLFQYLNEIKEFLPGNAVRPANPSDRVTVEYTASRNRN
jgi:hypothetical protein